MKREEREEIVKRLFDIAEDRKTFFKDDGDDEVFREDYAALVKAAQLLDDLDAETARADRAEEAGYYAACMKAISDVACKLANVMADRDRLSEQVSAFEWAIREHKPNDGTFACYSCDIVLDGKTDGRCKKCVKRRNWVFDEARFTEGKDGE